MNPAQLLAHFDRISEAPDAVPDLRRFIFDLAVRGKLVEQDPRDEPASKLLQRIDAEKVLLVKQGKIRKQELLEDIDESDIPFELPAGWVWSRLGNIGDWGSGSTPPRGTSEYYGGETTWLKSGELGDRLALKGSEERVTAVALQKCSFRLNQPGDVLIAMYGATIGKLAILAEPAVTNQAVCGCTPFAGILNRYLFTYLLSRRADFHAQSEGGAQPNISKIKIVLSPFALPPLAEQQRIVAKVDELMALCDRLEAAQAERESRRDRLVASSLNRFNNGAVADAFRNHARFYFNHLPRLTTRSEHIQQLRKTILNLAVRGQLVPQDPNDEPASELLKRIEMEKSRLVKEGTLARQKLASSEPKELAFDCPMNWQAVNFNDVCNLVTSGSRGWAEFYSDTGPKFIRAQNIRFGRLRLKDLACVSLPKKAEGTRTQVSKGDLLIVITGAGVTNPALLDHELGEAYVSQHVALIKPTATSLSRWLLLCLMAPVGARAELVERAYGAGKPGLNLDNIRFLRIPFPPLAEQQRIVAKVEELMALCDRLETQLTTTQTESRRLLEAVLHEAISVCSGLKQVSSL